MKESLFVASLNRLVPISDKEWEGIQPHIQVQKLSKKQLFQTPSTNCFFIGFLTTGCLRVYVQSEEGKECSQYFIASNQVFGDVGGKGNQFEGYQAMAESELLTINIANSLADPYLERVKYELIGRAHHFYQERINQLLLSSAEERYAMFKAKHESVLGFLPDYCVASYIGVSPVHLSRIKQNLM